MCVIAENIIQAVPEFRAVPGHFHMASEHRQGDGGKVGAVDDMLRVGQVQETGHGARIGVTGEIEVELVHRNLHIPVLNAQNPVEPVICDRKA